jgi:hypothetical protein
MSKHSKDHSQAQNKDYFLVLKIDELSKKHKRGDE